MESAPLQRVRTEYTERVFDRVMVHLVNESRRQLQSQYTYIWAGEAK
jgi:hypothetical protein